MKKKRTIRQKQAAATNFLIQYYHVPIRVHSYTAKEDRFWIRIRPEVDGIAWSVTVWGTTSLHWQTKTLITQLASINKHNIFPKARFAAYVRRVKRSKKHAS